MAKKKELIHFEHRTNRVVLVGSAELRRYTTDEIAEGLARLQPSSVQIIDQPIIELPALPASVTSLTLSRLPALASIDRIAACVRLRELSLDAVPALDLERGFAALAQLPEPVRLTLGFRMSVPAAVEKLASLLALACNAPDLATLRFARHVRELSLRCDQPITDELLGWSQLVRLELRAPGPIAPSLRGLATLEELVIGSAISGASITELPAWIGELTRLRTVDVLATNIKQLPATLANLPELRTLVLPGFVEELPEQLLGLSLDVRGGTSATIARFTQPPPPPLGEIVEISNNVRHPPDLGDPRELAIYRWIDQPLEQLARMTRLRVLDLRARDAAYVVPYLPRDLTKLALRSTAAALPSLAALHALEQLELAMPLARFPDDLRDLPLHTIAVEGLNAAGPIELSPLADIAALRSLHVKAFANLVLLELFAHLPRLRSLDIEGCTLRDERLPTQIGMLQAMEKLRIYGTRLAELPVLAPCDALTEVRVHRDFVPTGFRKCLPKGDWQSYTENEETVFVR